jgi:glycosyltransferase involved in cell wall biosynthesis
MKILHLEASAGWGGQEIRILHEAEGMRKRGHEVILAVMKGGLLINRAKKAGFTVYELNFKRSSWLICLFQLCIILSRHQIELVNTHSSLDSWIGGIAARLMRRPIVRTRHLSTPIKQGLNSKLLYGQLADFVVTTCASIIPMICSHSGKTELSCKSIATGVDPEKIVVKEGETEAFRKQMGFKADDFLVGTACFMRSWKGIDDFLKAADILRSQLQIKWVIIGGGHAETYIKRSQEMGLEGVVFFTGHLDHPFGALKALDVFTLLSTANEGVSQAILQAAFLEKPLIATPTGGLCEVCIDQVTGFQVAPFSPDEVAKAVVVLKEQPALREQFGKNGRKLVEKEFFLSSTLDQMEKVYLRVLS